MIVILLLFFYMCKTGSADGMHVIVAMPQALRPEEKADHRLFICRADPFFYRRAAMMQETVCRPAPA